MAKYLKIKDHPAGTTYEGLEFYVEVNGRPMDFTDAVVTMTLTPTTGAAFDLNLPVTDVRGRFNIERQLIDFTPDVYQFEIKITMGNGDIKKYITGTWKIT